MPKGAFTYREWPLKLAEMAVVHLIVLRATPKIGL